MLCIYFIFDIFQHQAIFLNVVSGVALTETAGDLAVAAAICSRYFISWTINDFFVYKLVGVPCLLTFQFTQHLVITITFVVQFLGVPYSK